MRKKRKLHRLVHLTLHPDAHDALMALAPRRERSKLVSELILIMHRGPPPCPVESEPPPVTPVTTPPYNDSADHFAAELREIADRLQRITEAQTLRPAQDEAQEARAG